RASDFEELDKGVKLRPQEVQMARTLIDNLTSEFNPQEYKDEYREALLGVVEKKIAGEEIQVPEEPEETRVVDLMDALRASVEATKQKTASSSRKKPARRKAAAS